MSWVRTELLAGLVLGAVGVVSAGREPTGDLTNLWRQAGEKDGQACASCHTASGHDVWANEFSPPDISRRADGHMATPTARALMGAIFEARQTVRYRSMKIPLEPQGGILAGETPAERDAEFGDWLVGTGSLLGKSRVWSVADARRAAEHLRQTPLSSVRVGFPFDPLSRDPFRPLDGMSLADWLPDVGISMEATKVFCDATDAGLGLAEVNQKIEAAAGAPKTGLEFLSRAKRMALYEVFEGHPMEDPSLELPEDPVWAVGKFAAEQLESTPEALGMTPNQMQKAGVKPGQALDFVPMAKSWTWAAWTRNPSLRRIARDRNSRFGVYLLDAFVKGDALPMHAAYVAARRPLEEAAERPESALQPEINSFVNNGILPTIEPKGRADRSRFRGFVADLLRMDCLILTDDLANGKPLFNPFAARQQLGDLWDFVRPRIGRRERARTAKVVVPCLQALRALADKRPS